MVPSVSSTPSRASTSRPTPSCAVVLLCIPAPLATLYASMTMSFLSISGNQLNWGTTRDQIMSERKRRQLMAERFIAFSSIIPGLKVKRSWFDDDGIFCSYTPSLGSTSQKGMCSHKQVTGWPSTATSAMSLMSPLMEGKLKDMN
ncbi:hypothetical protein JHK82_055309 [Glycine max]|nr:hypothetical protein JHK86_055148 [Glycine max]KAG4917841.1 hypothetical protein JHK85_056122 [Glycine max]KAG5073939.1 hypothetical protein JHK84_055170 [Glycine max]KAG5076614.1 hypothetical protein JHK82_055309 [Glycine max]